MVRDRRVFRLELRRQRFSEKWLGVIGWIVVAYLLALCVAGIIVV